MNFPKWLRGLLNWFSTVETDSISEFVNMLRYVDAPKVWVYSCLSDKNKPKAGTWFCEVRFISSLADGRTVLLKREERVDVRDLQNKKEKRYRANVQLMANRLEQPVRLISSVMPNAAIIIEDLYSRRMSLKDFQGKYSMV